MFNNITPEQAGIKSSDLINFINVLNDNNLSMHSILMMKGDNVFLETYYAPFNANSIHRLYSETKSFVSVAIGLLVEEGKINLDDTLYSYFEDEIDFEVDELLKKQTIKENLQMTTCVGDNNWFKAKENDRVKYYFMQKAVRPAGLLFRYDSAGSMVLSALVEKVSGMSLFDYLNKKLFTKMGTFKNAYMLKAPCNRSWGDSGMMCTLKDVASLGRLVMNYGVYEGNRLMNSEYLLEATRKHVDNNEFGYLGIKSDGYGYQIWRVKENGFAFFGMGNELTIMFPDKDILFSCFANDQHYTSYREILLNALYDIVRNSSDKPLLENVEDYNSLKLLSNNQKIHYQKTKIDNNLINKINGVTYVCKGNNANINTFRLIFNNDGGLFIYNKDNQEKTIPFGINKNAFSKLPEEGYSNFVGKEKTTGYFYDIASSLAFSNDNRVIIDVRIIDKYLGTLFIMISFKDDYALIDLVKHAENFLEEYQGEIIAIVRD